MIRADMTLPENRRYALCSGLRTFARAVHAPLEELPTDLDALRKRLARYTPAMAGLSARRWANVLSLVRQSLTQVGVITTPARCRMPFAPDWAALFVPLTDKHARIGLCRLARFCTEHGIAPEQVSDDTLDAFLVAMTDSSLVKRPRIVHQMAIRIWNRRAGTLPGWPVQQLCAPSYSRTYALPWSRFPDSLRLEIDAYLERLGGEDILDDFDFRPLRPASIRTRRFQIRAYLAGLVISGVDPSNLTSLRDALEFNRVRRGLRVLLDRAPDRSTNQAHDIAGLLLSIGRHWLQLDAAVLATLRKMVARLKPAVQGLSAKNRARLRQFDDPANVAKLHLLPERLIKRTARSSTPSGAEALLVQSALAIEILLVAPLRRGNLARLELDRHLIRSRGGVLHLSIPEHETKNSMPIDMILPDRVATLLELYVSRYRPLLATTPSDHLFPGRGQRAKDPAGLALQVTDCIREQTGLEMHLHLFRHLAGKSYLDAHPGAYGVVRLLLGHKSVETTTRYYCGTETAAAVRHYDKHVLKLRDEFASRRVRAGQAARR